MNILISKICFGLILFHEENHVDYLSELHHLGPLGGHAARCSGFSCEDKHRHFSHLAVSHSEDALV